MSVDGIGRPPIPKGEIGSVGGTGASGAPGSTFRVEREAQVGGAASSDLLTRLERGEISAGDYVQARVDEAVRPLEGRISAEQLGLVRDALAEQLSTDPVVVELVRRATAGAPSQGESSG